MAEEANDPRTNLIIMGILVAIVVIPILICCCSTWIFQAFRTREDCIEHCGEIWGRGEGRQHNDCIQMCYEDYPSK